jgi:lysophospholipid acyltransferase (LPLAT)-like uncharacterized protein
LWLISWAGYLAIRGIGPTLRYSLSVEESDAPMRRPVVFAFWHRCIFPAAYFFRDLRVGVMTSRSFDGEYIARIISKLGYRALRGSSSRGAVGALMAMREELRQNEAVAFTIDGPRGPRYVAKPGAVRLASISGAPVAAFYIALQDPWVLNTWDGLMLPRPFSRALVRMSVPIPVPRDANDQQLEARQAELQHALERVQKFAEDNVHLAGTPAFPLFEGQIGEALGGPAAGLNSRRPA